MLTAVGNELKVLQLLAENLALCGYEMMREDATLKRGGMYVVLDRMETAGLIEGKFEARKGVSGRGVKVYRLKTEGALKLRKTMAALATA